MISFCPSDRSHPVWEMVINELDRRDDPLSDEPLPGCQLVSSCSNIFDPDQFARMLRHNFERHLNSNRAPLGLHFNAVWLKNNKGFKKELIKFIADMLDRNDVYFVTMLQVSNLIPKTSTSLKSSSLPGDPMDAEPN